MDREKEIEEMAKTLCCLYGTIECYTCAVICGVPENCERLYDAGYRKADEVRKETVEEIWEEVKGVCNRVAKYDYRLPNIEPFKNIFKKYGVEVNE